MAERRAPSNPRLTLVSLALLTASIIACGGEPQAADRRPTAAGVLRCTTEDEPTNFGAYHVGKEFEGLPLTSQDRVCSRAGPGRPPEERLNIVEYGYGDCNPGPGERCPVPLSVQSWPRCEGGFSRISSPRFIIRGVPARFQGGGLGLLTGDSMVVIFANNRGRMLRAARTLVRAPAKPSDPVGDAHASGPLPTPTPLPGACAAAAETPP
jgi:hypothetical protein